MILPANSHWSQLEASEISTIFYTVLLKLRTVSRYPVLIIITLEVIATSDDQFGLAGIYLCHYWATLAHSNNISVGDAPASNNISSLSDFMDIRWVWCAEEVDFGDEAEPSLYSRYKCIIPTLIQLLKLQLLQLL